VQASLGQSGVTYIGDAQRAALATRASVAASANYYLCPRPATQVPAEELERVLTPGWARPQALTPGGPIGSIPILAYTASATPERTQRALAAGCDDYLTKPLLKVALLQQKITQLLAKGQSPSRLPPLPAAN